MPSNVETFIKPLLGEKIITIHPAIDIFEGKAVIGVWLPSEVTEVKHVDGKDDEIKISRQMKPYHISSKRELVLLDDTLKNNGYMLACDPIQTAPRWDLTDVENFITQESLPPDPWGVLKELMEIWREHVDFEDWREYLFRVLWDMGTYFVPIFSTYPYDYVGGVKDTGKTTVLMVHSCLAFNAIGSGNVSTASMYRLIQNARCTFCIDETERLEQRVSDKMSERTYELRNLLLSGYKKGMPVYRSEKREKTGKIVPEPFEVFGPKATASIRGIEEVVGDRCKKTIMRRATPGRIKKEVDTEDPRWAALRNKMYRLFLGYWARVREIYSSPLKISELSERVNVTYEGRQEEEKLYGREGELWKPILTMALLVGEHTPTDTHGMFGELNEYNNIPAPQASLPTFTHSLRSPAQIMFGLAKESQKSKKAEDLSESAETVLVMVLLRLANTESFEDDYHKVQEIKNIMLQFYDEEQKWINTKWVGSALRRLGFNDSRRLGTGYQYKLTKKKIVDLAARLGVELPETPIVICFEKDFNDQITIDGVVYGPYAAGAVVPLPAKVAFIFEHDGYTKVRKQEVAE